MTFFGAMPMWGMGQNPPEVEAPRAYELAAAGDVVLVDVGEPHDWVSGHVPDAVLMGVRSPGELDRVPKDKPVIVACRDIELGAKVVAELRDAGYDAALLHGGVEAWVNCGLPLVAAGDATRR